MATSPQGIVCSIRFLGCVYPQAHQVLEHPPSMFVKDPRPTAD